MNNNPIYFQFIEFIMAFFAVAGFVLLIIAGKTYFSVRDLLATGTETNAVVTRLEQETDGEGDLVYRPWFEYKDQHAQVHEVKGEVASQPPAFEKGEHLKVVYDPSAPETYKVVSYWGLYRWPVICFAASLPMLVFGLSWLGYHYL